eukprot:TRINITY_DN110799_c0_g1_i1.p1 TRINITY_DN110799_c0_g1~~TRINITY_DN110799_c0_g1_i1.p1  ORF type:complete len:330 (+),score=85.81 TRINITY_DN110799_c0_g1_i1:80-1069(+)
MATDLISRVKTAFEHYWASDDSRRLSRKEMVDVLKKMDSSLLDTELQLLFDAMDANGNGTIEYEEFIEFVLSNEQVTDLAMRELDLLQLAVGSQPRVTPNDALDEDAEIARILEESRREATEYARMQEDRLRLDDEAAIQRALEASAADELAIAAREEEARRKQEDEDRRLLETSAREAKDEADRLARARAAMEEAQFEEALRASEQAVAEDLERKKKKHEEEDNSELFRAALRASCLDLGPRGISQAAKVFATGDPTLGQPKSGFDTTTSGARGRRGKSAIGEAPKFTGKEKADGKAPVAGRAESPGALRRQTEWASRTSGSSAFKGR